MRIFFIPIIFFVVSVSLFVFFLRGIPLLLRRLFGQAEHWMRFRRPRAVPRWVRKGRLRGLAPEADRGDLESAVFSLAYRLRGRITLSDIIVETGLGMKEAEDVIGGMVDGIRVRMEVTEDGLVIYEFPEIIARFEGPSGV